jgi:hypothetical protein
MSEPEARTARAEGGFSLLEVIIGATILFTIIAIAGKFITTSTNLLGTLASRSESDQSASRIADNLARLFRNASLASVKLNYSYNPAPPASSFPEGVIYSTIYLRLVKENSGTPVYGDGYYIFPAVDESSYTDSIDNDKDSRTDEVCAKMCTIPAANHVSQVDPAAGALYNASWYNKQAKVSDIRWYNTLPQYPKAPASAEPGIQFIRNGAVLTIRVVTLKYDPAAKVQVNSMAEATVKLRN